MSIYTRTGDTGTTAVFGGKRVLKCEELVEVYGSIDELNSWVGYMAAEFSTADVTQFLGVIQSDLFTIGSTLAGWKDADLGALETRVKEMEARIDVLEETLPAIKNLFFPEGQKKQHVHISPEVSAGAQNGKRLHYYRSRWLIRSSSSTSTDFQTCFFSSPGL